MARVQEVPLEFGNLADLDDDGTCFEAKVEVEAKSKVPVYRSKPYHMRVTRGGFLFNQDFPKELGAQGLPFNEGDKP